MFSEDLVNLKVNSLEINSDKTVIVLNTDSGKRYLVAEGDCCSNSWFENISGLDNLIGQTILEVTDVDLPDKNIDTDYEYFKFYSYKLRTPKGVCELEYRNSSNGYYGGSVSVEEELNKYYDEDLKNLKQVTKDF